jgi:hypothetical protein
MSHWNYRVVRKEGALAIHAVYYDDSGEVEGWSERPFSPVAESCDELRTNLELMLEALGKDVLNIESFRRSAI